MLVCAALELYALADRSRGEPRDLDIRRYVLGEIFDGHRVEQRFSVRADRLSSVTVYPRAASPAPTGNVILELRDITDGANYPALERVSVPLASMARMRSFTMHFRPQPSFFRDYALQVSVEGSSDGQGIGLLAARGGRFRGYNYSTPTLLINGRRQFGSLVFRTTVDRAMSNFESIASQLAQAGIPAPRIVLLFVLIAKYLALFAVIRAFARPSGEATLAAQAPPSLPASRAVPIES